MFQHPQMMDRTQASKARIDDFNLGTKALRQVGFKER
jgi:hypothetical protein